MSCSQMYNARTILLHVPQLLMVLLAMQQVTCMTVFVLVLRCVVAACAAGYPYDVQQRRHPQ